MRPNANGEGGSWEVVSRASITLGVLASADDSFLRPACDDLGLLSVQTTLTSAEGRRRVAASSDLVVVLRVCADQDGPDARTPERGRVPARVKRRIGELSLCDSAHGPKQVVVVNNTSRRQNRLDLRWYEPTSPAAIAFPGRHLCKVSRKSEIPCFTKTPCVPCLNSPSTAPVLSMWLPVCLFGCPWCFRQRLEHCMLCTS